MSRSARTALLPLVRGEPLEPPRSPQAARELVAEARRQGLVANLRAAAERAPEAWPEALRQELAQQHQHQLVRGLRQLQVAGEAQRLLARAGVRSLPLKGAALAEDLYESVADRPMADVDLLLLDGFPVGLEALLGAGFSVEDAGDHAVCLQHEPSGVRLEAHLGLASCPRLHPVDAEGWWARRRAAPDGQGARPSWEDLLAQMALHAAFQHGLVLSLVQYQDL
ncbi:MAG TPA: nucleotidyltransferase family protein, partial [Vicinamibacteria bacterium]